MPAKDQLIYLFTTAGPSKPTYRRGILDLLTYPPGHIQQFSYRRSDIHPKVAQLMSFGTEEKAVVVFVDMGPQDAATYVPVRWVSVRETSPGLGSERGGDPEGRVKFFLQIGNYIRYQRSHDFRRWHEQLRFLDAAREVKDGRVRYFVVAGEDVFGPPEISEELSWEDLVRAVSQSSRFSDAIFLRLNHLKSYRQHSADVVLGKYGHGPRSYLLRPGQDYRLDFDVFVRPNVSPSKAAAPNVALACSSELIKTTKPFQSVVSGLVQQFAILSCKRTIEETKAALSVEIAEPVIDVVNTPNPVLLLEISVPRRVLVFFVLCVFFGGVFVSADKEALAAILPAAGFWIWVAKFVGSALLAIAAFLGFRKLPSGQG